MSKEKESSSVYYDTEFNKIRKLTERIAKLELAHMELLAEKEIRKKAEQHIEELVNIIKGEQ